ncbi:MAG: hypothetical protein IPP72_04705 [Chitinophagaceae bacterium]|nr:hypothetical protein [Chitinophagaceae bacterium]
MKKLFLLLLVITACAVTTYAQWTYTGNNATYNPSGVVGIGGITTGIQGKLHIGDNTLAGIILDNRLSAFSTKIGAQLIWAESGGNYLAGDLLIAPRTSGANCAVRFITGTTPVERLTIGGSGNVGINVTNPSYPLQIKSFGSTNTTTALHIQNSAGTEMVRLIDNGNLGIGTSVPQSQLNIKSTAANPSPLILLEKLTGGVNDRIGGLRFISGTGYYSGIEGYGTGGTDQMDLRFYTSYSPAQQGVERMRIKQTGEVSITGTTTSTVKLDIIGAGAGNIDFQTTGRARIKSTAPGLWLNDNTTDKSFIGYTSGIANHAVGIFSPATNQWEFNMLQNGSIGIGTSVPNTNAKLDVNGNIYCSSKVYIGTPDANTATKMTMFLIKAISCSQ